MLVLYTNRGTITVSEVERALAGAGFKTAFLG